MCVSYGVCVLCCVAVAVYRNCCLWEIRYMGVAVRESCGVRELQCGGVSLWGGHGGCQSLIHCVYGVFIFSLSFWFCAKKKILF